MKNGDANQSSLVVVAFVVVIVIVVVLSDACSTQCL